MKTKIKNIKVSPEVHKLIGKLGTTNEDYGDVVEKLARFYVERNKISL
jgi:hypothetical protein